MLFLVAALSVPFARLIADDKPDATSAAAPSQGDYILQPYDQIKIEIFQEPDLSRDVRLSQESAVSLPLVGTVHLKDKTIQAAQEIVRDLYNQDYLVDPQISISVLEYAKETVTVLGSVGSPGAIPLPPDQKFKLLDVVARAGGFTRIADRKHVKLTRTAADGKTSTTVVNANDIIQGTSDDSWVIQKGDVIFVPERLL